MKNKCYRKQRNLIVSKFKAVIKISPIKSENKVWTAVVLPFLLRHTLSSVTNGFSSAVSLIKSKG